VAVECFHLVGIVSVTALAANFHGVVAEKILAWWSGDPSILRFACFFALFFGAAFLVRFAIFRLVSLIKSERVPWFVQWLGLALGLIRGVWVSGLVVLVMLSLESPYLAQSIHERSVSGPRLVSIAQRGMEWVADRFPGHLNRAVLIPSTKLELPRLPKFDEDEF
jgi:uncharacterized membrane protein required for colicin V production